MKVLCTQEKLLEATQMVERLVGKKESLPVLSCVLVEARKSSLLLRATNLETGVEVKIPAEVKEEGVVAIPVSVFSQTLRSLRALKVELSVDSDKNLTIHSNNGTTTIKTISPEEFPTLPKGEGTAHEIAKKALIDSLQSVSYAASQSMIRPELASILLSYKDGQLICAATDSFRLAEKTVQVTLPEVFPDTLIPVKNALDLLHILASVKTEHINVIFDESQLTVISDGIAFFSRIIDATFPQYREIIPKTFVAEATLLKEDLNAVVKKARIFSQLSQEVGLHIYPKKKEFIATARSADVGETSDSIDAALEGEDLDIKFNIHYLSECLPSIHSDSVEMRFGGIGKPLIIKGVSDQSFLYLVMPLNR